MRKMCDEAPCPIQGQEAGYAVFTDACRGVDALPEADRAEAAKRIVLAFTNQALCALPQADAAHLVGALLTLLGNVHGVSVRHVTSAPPSQARH